MPKNPSFLHTHDHMALFGVSARFAALECTAWQQATDDTHTLTTREEPLGLSCPAPGLMTPRAAGATDGPR